MVSTRRRVWFSSVLPWGQAATLLLLTAWLYGSTLVRLFLQWMNDPNFSHGIFVPAFALFVVWQNRNTLKNVERRPSWAGLFIVVLALLMAVLGVLGAEVFTSRISMLIMLAGLIILFGGWRLFRAVLFPWAFLFLMIPIPSLIFQQITFPLQMLASKVASGLLPLLGVPVLREGNVIALPAMMLEVAEACSGIRSLISLVTLAIIYGYLMDSRKWVRVVLAFSAVPIAVAANSLRIIGTGLLVQYWDPDKAMGFFHGFEGWLIFVVSLIMLFGLHQIIIRLAGRAPEETTPSALPQGPSSGNRPNPSGFRFGFVAALLAITALGLEARSRNEVFPPRQSLNSIPSQLGDWTGQDVTIEQQTLDILGAGEFLLRDYTDSVQQQPPVGLFLAYFPSQKTGDTIHSPNHCLPGAGWVPVQRKIIQIPRPDGSSFPANRYVISKSGERALVLYWYLAHDRAIASEYSAKYYLIADSIHMNRSDGALVRLLTPMYKQESADAAQARAMKLGSQLIPILNNYIPR